MPVYNITIPDTSPMIVYSSNQWSDSSHTDSEWLDYTEGTFHATNIDGASASLFFNGSAVYVVGAERPNHGDYWATLDGHTSQKTVHVTQDIFNATVFSGDGLDSTEHSLVMQNKGGAAQTWFDIDYITITVGNGDPNTNSSNIVLDDGDGNITYSAGWDSSPNEYQYYYYEQTMHRTNILGASASVNFYGNAITLYGATSVNHGLFSINLDGVPVPTLFNGSAPLNFPRWQNILYYTGGLPTGMHTLTVAHADPNGPAFYFDLDKVVVSTWPVSDATSNAMSTGTASSTSSAGPSASIPAGLNQSNTKKGLSNGLIAGIAILAVAAVALVCALLFYLRRRQGRRQLDDAADKEEVIEQPRRADYLIEPFVGERRPHVPFPPSSSSYSQVDQATTSERTPLSPGLSADREQRVPRVSSSYDSETKYILPQNPEQNPHRDFPPPGYDEVVASNTRLP